MTSCGSWFKSSIGLKVVAGISGICLLGFIVSHLIGNLLIYEGSMAINNYAKGLKNLPLGLLYVLRTGLFFCFAIHILSVAKLQLVNSSARPVGYLSKATIQASLASRTMVYSGCLILAFLLYHLSHFTWHLFGDIPMLDDGYVDVYKMVVLGFGNPLIAGTYILAMIVLGFHLSHGIASFFQTVGLQSRKRLKTIKCLGTGLAWGIALLNISIPVSVWLGCIK